MRKRYAANYTYIVDYGYFKQHIVETENGLVARFFPLTSEVPSVVWLPGMLIIYPKNTVKWPPDAGIFVTESNPESPPADFFCQNKYMVAQADKFDFLNMRPFENCVYHPLTD